MSLNRVFAAGATKTSPWWMSMDMHNRAAGCRCEFGNRSIW